MKKSSQRAPAQSKRNTGRRSTAGRDDMTNNSSKKDYFVANALEITPHPNQQLKAVLGQPVMNRKLKYSILETNLAASNATSATPLSLVSINQGTTDITRTGDRVRVKRIWFGGKLNGNAAATAAVMCRVIIVCWNPVGTGAVNAPIASQIIQHSAGYGPHGSYSRDFGDSFQIVHDAKFSVNPVAATTENEILHLDRKVLVDMEFTAGATVPTTNNFYVFFLTDTGINVPNLTFSSTIWYEDLDA